MTDICGQATCDESATHKVYWPGSPILACEKHQEELVALGEKMGLVVTWEALDPLPAAWGIVKQALKDDYELAWAYHCQIAVSAMDEGVSHHTAQKIAERSMSLLFGLDTSLGEPTRTDSTPEEPTEPEWAEAMEQQRELNEEMHRRAVGPQDVHRRMREDGTLL